MGLFWAHSADFSPRLGDSSPFADASLAAAPRYAQRARGQLRVERLHAGRAENRDRSGCRELGRVEARNPLALQLPAQSPFDSSERGPFLGGH